MSKEDSPLIPKGLIKPEKCKEKTSFWSKITIEPIWIGSIMPLSAIETINSNLALQRACLVDLGYSHEDCITGNHTLNKTIEMESQKVVTSLSAGSNLVSSVIVGIIIVFLGPWSDRTGRRKPLLIQYFLGITATSLIMLLIQFIPSANAAWVVYMQIIPSAIGGNMSLLHLAAYSYLGDLCYKAKENPITKMGYNSATSSVATIFGSLFGPIMLRSVGFIGSYSITTSIKILTLMFILITIKDVFASKEKSSLFDLSLPINAFKCLVKKREGKRRKNVILLVIIPSFLNFLYAAEFVLLYLYLRYKFQWTEVEYGLFTTLRGITSFLGTILIIKLLKHKMKLEDETIAIIGSVSQILCTIVLILSTQGWHIFLAPLIGIFARACIFMKKSLLVKQISPKEIGQLLSLSSILDKVATFCIIPSVTYIYSQTISSFPSLFLFFSIFGILCLLVGYASVTVYQPFENIEEEKEKENMISNK